MPVQKHVHKEGCEYSGDGYLHYLVSAAPSILWYNVQDVGSYQGSVYGVGEYKKQILIYEDSYGSCSGCGAWGEGGEPKNEEGVLSMSKLFSNVAEAMKYLAKIDYYDAPDMDALTQAVKEVSEDIQK
jgi:hypothetical protein